MANPGLVLSLLGGCWFILHSIITEVISPRYAEALLMVHQRSESSAGPQSGSVRVNVKYIHRQAVLGLPMQKETACAPNNMVGFKEDKGSPWCLSKGVLLRMNEVV